MLRAYLFLEFDENEWDILLCTSMLIGAKFFQLDKHLPQLLHIIYVMRSSKSLSKVLSKDF